MLITLDKLKELEVDVKEVLKVNGIRPHELQTELIYDPVAKGKFLNFKVYIDGEYIC